MEIAKIFMNGRSQAVRLPKKFRFSCNEVVLKKEGDILSITPKANKWEDFFSLDESCCDNFLSERCGRQRKKKKE